MGEHKGSPILTRVTSELTCVAPELTCVAPELTLVTS